MAMYSTSGMRVLALEPTPRFGGGSEAVALSLSEELAKSGCEVLLLHDAAGSMLERYSKFCAKVERLELPGVSLRAPKRSLVAALRVARFLKRERIDVAFCSNTDCIEAAALIRALSGVQFCFHLGLPCRGRSARQRFAIRRIGFGVAPSAHTAASWANAGWAQERLAVVANWVDANRFRPAVDREELRSRLEIPMEARCIVFMGRLCPEKGVGDLLAAFGRTWEGVPGATLLLVGEIADYYRTELGERLGHLPPSCREQVRILGATEHPEDYLAASDLVCAPSRIEESFGLVVLEAMACGVPVVAARVGIVPAILGTPGQELLVDPADQAGLAERLLHFLGNPSWSVEVGKSLRQRALDQFSAAGAVSAYESILQSLAQEKTRC